MRSMRFLMALVSLCYGGISAHADGDIASAGRQAALPASQPSVIVSLERGVRVWRPVAEDNFEVYYAQPTYQGAVEGPRRDAALSSYEAPVGTGGYAAYGRYGGIGINRGYGARGQHAGGGAGVSIGRVLPNRYPVIGGAHYSRVVINARVPAPYGGYAGGHGHSGAYAPASKVAGHGFGRSVLGHRGGYGHGHHR